MKFNMEKGFSIKLKELAEKIKIKLDEEQINKYYNYMNLLLEWNEKINLTAITEQNDIILKHFVDSMTSLKYLEEVKTIIDVGTGAGFPGIPIAIVDEEKKVTLVDSLNKRIKFLDDVKEKNELKNVITIHSRAEDIGKDNKYREKYDVAVSRAVANLSTLVEYLLPLVKLGGKCICMKGANIEEEIENSKIAIKKLGGRIEKVEEFYLPDSDMKRNIIVIRKINKTDQKYPRKAGIPSKEPLK